MADLEHLLLRSDQQLLATKYLLLQSGRLQFLGIVTVEGDVFAEWARCEALDLAVPKSMLRQLKLPMLWDYLFTLNSYHKLGIRVWL